jgi:hypothetical protein
LIWAGTMAAGETRSIPRSGSIFIQATPPENLDIDLDGKRKNWGQALAAYPGYNDKGEIQAPAP